MFLILALSSLSPGTDYVFAESVSENFESTPQSKMFTIDLIESIGIKEPQKYSEKSKQYNVSLQEKIGLTNFSAIDEVVLIKYESDRKAILERISDRQSKLKFAESKLPQINSPSSLKYYEQDNDLISENFGLFNNESFFGINNLIPNIFESELIIPNFSVDQNILSQNNIEMINDQFFDPDNPILLIFLIPFAGFVLIRYDNEQIKFHQLKQIFTSIFIIILVSSAVITPLSISKSYWGNYAFAELDNSTEIISELESTDNILQNNVTNILQDNSTNIFESNNELPEVISPEFYSIKPNNDLSMSDVLSIILTEFTGNTTPSIDNATLSTGSDFLATDSNMSMSDVLSIKLSKFTGNGTYSSTSDFLATDSNMSMSDVLSIILTEFIGNATSSTGPTVSVDANISLSDTLEVIFTPGFSIDDATLSMQFDSIENETALLDGDQDLIQVNASSTNDLRSLVIGAWVKPDYSQGSPEFTVLSKEKSFSLTIDNQISSHAAKFSIFDGIKWTQVNSNYEIPEEWTYLTASFSNQTISIYVNGEYAGTKQVEGLPSLSLDGKLEFVDIESISSESDIVVGAYITIKDGKHTNNMFSGVIDDVALFDYALSDVEIRQLYSEGLATHAPAQTDSSDALQAQLSLSDTLSYVYSQAQNNTQVQTDSSDALQAQLSLSDTLSYIHAQVQNNTSTSLVVANAILF